jgi:hypothetical protein
LAGGEQFVLERGAEMPACGGVWVGRTPDGFVPVLDQVEMALDLSRAAEGGFCRLSLDWLNGFSALQYSTGLR